MELIIGLIFGAAAFFAVRKLMHFSFDAGFEAGVDAINATRMHVMVFKDESGDYMFYDTKDRSFLLQTKDLEAGIKFFSDKVDFRRADKENIVIPYFCVFEDAKPI